jgi:hypothetical protein
MRDYEVSGAVRKVCWDDTGHLVPWFLLEKPEGNGTKVRMISDCRRINKEFQPGKFRLDHLAQIFPHLSRGSFAGKIDLKDAYFHVGLHPELRPFFRHQIGDQVWEYQAGPFGLNIMPQLFMKIVGVVEKVCRARGIQLFVYLDDILVLAPSEKLLQRHLDQVVDVLLQAGFKINLKKSILKPVQVLEHLGFTLNFLTGRLEVPSHRVKSLRKELGKFLLKKSMAKRQVAAILGKIRSMLVALPFLRGFTDTLVRFLRLKGESPWDSKYDITEDIREQLREVRGILESWSGRCFSQAVQQRLHSDASSLGWGGIDLVSRQVLHEFWRGREGHINMKELLAAINTVKGLGRPNTVVEITVDNQVVYWYLAKGGGRKEEFNGLLRPFWRWLELKNVDLRVRWVPSAEMQADYISRWQLDRGDYSLNQALFACLMQVFRPWMDLKTDLFASPGNAKLPSFVARHPHFEAAACDALQCDLGKLGGDFFANPPWSVINQFLPRLREFPALRFLVVCPWWDSAIWWPQLIKLRVPGAPCLRVKPFRGMFTNCAGEEMPPPRWDLCCMMCSGKFWRGNKYRVRPWKISWDEIRPYGDMGLA